MSKYDHSVMFVCRGNYCRSPMAEYVFRSLTKKKKWSISSCAVGASSNENSSNWGRAHEKTIKIVEEKHGGDTGISEHPGRDIKNEDFEKYEYMLCMDGSNFRNVKKRKGKVKGCKTKVEMLTKYSNRKYRKVPDPWEMGETREDFEKVYEIVLCCLDNFLKEVEK